MQNKFVILALLGLASASQSVQVNTKNLKQPAQKAPQPTQQLQQKQAAPQKMAQSKSKAPGDAAAEQTAAGMGAVAAKAAIHNEIRSTARKLDIQPPSQEQIKKNMYIPPAEELEKDTEAVGKLMKEVRAVGGDSGKKDKSAVMSDADQQCYASRYEDVKTNAKEHFKLTGDAQGRLGTCARDLSDYEALTYLHSFPELQAKFGDGASAIKQARKHYREIGYAQAHFSEPMKDTTKMAWKCGEGAKQSCKCHGTLWYGPTVAPDNKKPITTWNQMREWKTVTKESEEWMSCTDANFGSDPWPNQEKQCWCEDKPAYKPHKCAEEGEECLCDGGWVVYGAKLDADKKEMDFFSTVKLSLAITGTKGKKSLACETGTFAGADPAPNDEKVCFCDQQQKFFDSSFVKATKTFWHSSQLEKQAEGELRRTAEHASEVSKVTKEKDASSTETSTSAAVENEKAKADIAAAKTCAIQAIEESYRFRKTKIEAKKVTLERTIGQRRAQVTTWQFQLNLKQTAAEETCVQLNKKGVAEKARLEDDCKRMTTESNELRTQISVEIEKINEEERVGQAAIRLEESKLESKRTKETITIEEKSDEESNEINEAATEKRLELAEEKEALLQQQQELIKIQQKTSKKIEASIKDQQGAINILITNLRKKLTGMARKEQVLTSELSDDAPERQTVVNRIITRSKETITKLTKVQTELKDKKTKTTSEQATLKIEVKSITDRLTSIQAKIVTAQENLKLKIAERTSKKAILATYGDKANVASAKTTAGSAASAESVIVTQGAIDKISTDIKTIRDSIKVNIQQKNEIFTTKVTTQKQIDLQVNQIKTIDEQLKNIKDFIMEVEGTIQTVESKIKEEIATKKVVETQKEAFKAAQKKTEAEESVNQVRIVEEKKKEEKTAESKQCKKEYDVAASKVKTVQDAIKTQAKAGQQADKVANAKMEANLEETKKQLEVAQKDLDAQTKACATVDASLAKVVTESKSKMEKLTKTVEEATKTSETAEKTAKATIVTLPGGDKDIAKEESKETETVGASITNASITITAAKGAGKTATGKPKAPGIPAPKPKEEEPKKDEDGKPIKEPVPVPVTTTSVVKKTQKTIGTVVVTDDDEDDGEPVLENPTEVPGGEAQITKEVTDNTIAAHEARVELVKTKENMKYELETIKEKLEKFNNAIKETKARIVSTTSQISSESAKLEGMKATAVTASIAGADIKGEKPKMEVEISTQVATITELEAQVTKDETTVIEYKSKVEQLTERRKQIKYQIEIKVLEAKESEAAVVEAIKTVTDVELLNRKRWIASKTVGSYQKCVKYMAEYKMIFEKQGQTLAAEHMDHSRRIDIATGAITSLEEKLVLLRDAKQTKDLAAQIERINVEITKHTKTVEVEKKILVANKSKMEKNFQDFDEHNEKCAKAKVRANIATAAVNDAATTLKNQREYQVQVTNLKNILVGSHEQALSKRQEANKIHMNYTQMVTKFEQEVSVTNEQIMDSKTKISGAQEIQRIVAVRLKEIATLTGRPTITAAEKTKLTTEESDIKNKIETQQNIVDTETKKLVQFETTLATLATTIKTFKGYISEVKTVIKALEKKVTETKQALKVTPKKEAKEAPPVKGKDTESKDAENVDEEGDAKVADVDEASEEVTEEVKGGNEKVDKELDQVEEENSSVTTQIDSLTKTITTVEEKSEIADKEVIQETADTASEDSQLSAIKIEKERLVRVRERQRCARLFPIPFSSFKIGAELKQENMCPCPGAGKGLTLLFLENIKDAGEFDKFVLHLFEKNLAVEGSFNAQVNRMSMGADQEVAQSDEESFTLRLIVSDDKIDAVMAALDAQALSMKSTDFKISPLLKGKIEYQKWQQTNLASRASAARVHKGGDMLEDEMDDEMEME